MTSWTEHTTGNRPGTLSQIATHSVTVSQGADYLEPTPSPDIHGASTEDAYNKTRHTKHDGHSTTDTSFKLTTTRTVEKASKTSKGCIPNRKEDVGSTYTTDQLSPDDSKMTSEISTKRGKFCKFELNSELRIHLNTELENELRVRLTEELKGELKRQINVNQKIDMKKELKDGIKTEPKEEIKGELKRELRVGLKKEVKDELEQNLRTEPTTQVLLRKVLPYLFLFSEDLSVVRLAQSCRWLFKEISDTSALWEIRYRQRFQFDRDYQELEWLQQLRERQRPWISSIILADGKTNRHHTLRRTRKTYIGMDWFHAYCWRQQTAYNLLYSTPTERTISLPKEYHQSDWGLVTANPLCFVFESEESNSLLTYQPISSIGKESNSSKSTYSIATGIPNKVGHFNRLTLDKDRKGTKWYKADRDVVVAYIHEGIDENVYGVYAFLWRIGPNHRWRIHWPYSSDANACPPCEWYAKCIQQDWIIAYRKVDGLILTRVYNITHGRWCGGEVMIKPARYYRFQKTTQDTAQMFYCSEEIVSGCNQFVCQLWEFYIDGMTERCIKSTTIIPSIDEGDFLQVCRLSDNQSTVVFKGKDDTVNPFTLTLYGIGASLSFSFKWKTKMSGEVRYVKFIPSREEMVVAVYDSAILYVLNLSDGTILRQFNLSSEGRLIYPLLGSLCRYWNTSSLHRLIDTQTGKDCSFSYDSVYLCHNSSEYKISHAKKNINNHQLTLLDWHY